MFMNTYACLVERYTARDLSFDSDASNAFWSVEAALMKTYRQGGSREHDIYELYFGLP